MPQIGVVEILIVVVIILLLFGPERLSKLAGELGKGIRAFKDGVSDGEKKGENAEDSKTKKDK